MKQMKMKVKVKRMKKLVNNKNDTIQIIEPMFKLQCNTQTATAHATSF